MIIFRVDGNRDTGLGHVMRCLSIANAARERGEECLFATADTQPHEIILEQDFRVLSLDTDYRIMDGELSRLRRIMDKERPSHLVVDSYHVTESYLRQCQGMADRLVCIDDLAEFAYPCDTLVNYNIYGPDLDYAGLYGDSVPRLLLGPEYAPLRREFVLEHGRGIAERIQKVLVLAGGSDPAHIAVKMAAYLKENPMEYEFHFVIGAMNCDEISGVVVHRNVKNISSLMMQCDAAISAAGSTLYELCACGVPTIAFTLADNQIPGARAFSQKGLMEYVGDARHEENICADIFQRLRCLDEEYPRRRQMAADCRSVVDGRGAERIVSSI